MRSSSPSAARSLWDYRSRTARRRRQRYCGRCKTPASASQAEAALAQAKATETPFDVVIIDVKGLACEGVQLARKVRIEQQESRPEVILLMGLDGSVADNSLENLGAFALLTKPARPSVLFDCLASIASGSRENGIASFYIRKSGAAPRVK